MRELLHALATRTVSKGMGKKTSQHTSNEVYADKKITVIFCVLYPQCLPIVIAIAAMCYVCGIT
jgi:hypothetical protein